MIRKEDETDDNSGLTENPRATDVPISLGELDGFVRRRIREELDDRAVQRGNTDEPSKWTRRETIGLFGLGAIGSASNGRPSGGEVAHTPTRTNELDGQMNDFEVPELTADQITANRVDIKDQLTVSGTIIDGSGSGSTPGVIVAETAADIQPAIDKLTERVETVSGTGDRILGGVVQLLPKAYYPTDTIFLKAGVTLQGALPVKQGAGRAETTGWQGTTIYTSEMPTGSAYEVDPANGAHTYRHFNDEQIHDKFANAGGTPWEGTSLSEDEWYKANTHPHLPVILSYNQLPIYSDETPTQYQQDHWGDGVALRNLTLKADKKRFWDPANETAGSQAEKHAMYYGVYDGILFENLAGGLVENVNVEGFQGYCGFYQDIRNMVSRGNTYSGTATDYHGTALVLGTSAEDSSQRYMRGQWSVRVEAPTPCVTVENHAVNSQFVNGAWTKNAIIGGKCEFLDSSTSQDGFSKYYDDGESYASAEAVYDAGAAPIVDKENKHVIVHQPDGSIQWHGYVIDTEPGGVDTPKIAYRMNDSNTFINSMRVGRAGTDIDIAFDEVSQRNVIIANSRISGNRYGISTYNDIPTVINSKVDSVYINGKADVGRPWVNVEIGDIDGSVNNTSDTWHIIGGRLTGSINDVAGWQESNALSISGMQNYTNDAAGAKSSVSDGDTIPHGLDERPVWASVETQSNVHARVTNVSSTDMTISLYDPDGSTAGSSEDLYWQAKGWSAPGVNV